MDGIEYYQIRADECARLANNSSDEEARADLLFKAKAYLGVVTGLRDYFDGKGLSVLPH
jgi:hypothetical protein